MAREQAVSERSGEILEVPVTLTIFGARPVSGVASVQRRGLAERARCAALALGASWLLAFAAVFFPVLHFVLVPGLLIGGVVLAVVFLREDRTLASVRGRCPRCGIALELAPGGRFRLPRPVQCLHCKNTLTLEADAPRHDAG